MSDKKTEKKKPLHDWSFMVNPNPPAGRAIACNSAGNLDRGVERYLGEFYSKGG